MDKQHASKCQHEPCTCDGYHTFDELYEHRIVLYIQLCKQPNIMANHGVWRSKTHSDGSVWDGWFILGIGMAPGEQISYHLPISKWEDTNFAHTFEKAPEFDGHTSDDVLSRLAKLTHTAAAQEEGNDR